MGRASPRPWPPLWTSPSGPARRARNRARPRHQPPPSTAHALRDARCPRRRFMPWSPRSDEYCGRAAPTSTPCVTPGTRTTKPVPGTVTTPGSTAASPSTSSPALWSTTSLQGWTLEEVHAFGEGSLPRRLWRGTQTAPGGPAGTARENPRRPSAGYQSAKSASVQTIQRSCTHIAAVPRGLPARAIRTVNGGITRPTPDLLPLLPPPTADTAHSHQSSVTKTSARAS